MEKRCPPLKRRFILDKIKYADFKFDPESHHRIFHNHLVECFEENNSIGVKKDGEIIIPPIYNNIRLVKYKSWGLYRFLALVKTKVDSGMFKWGILSEGNHFIEDAIYDHITWFMNGSHISSSLKLWLNGNCYVFSLTCKFPKFEIDNYSFIGDFISFSLFSKIKETKDYRIDNTIVDKKYAFVIKEGKYGILLDDGSVPIKPELFTNLKDIHIVQEKDERKLMLYAQFEDYRKIEVDLRGYFDGIIPPTYKSAIRYNMFRYIVQNYNGKWGIIDSKNHLICDFLYDEYFENFRGLWHRDNKHYAIFVCGKRKVLVDVFTGERVSDYYDSLLWLSDPNYCHVGINQKFGIITSHGETIIPCIYDRIYGAYVTRAGVQSTDAIFEGKHGKIVDSVFIKEVIKPATSANNRDFEIDSYEERPTYVKYEGTYAQDVAGYSDDEIDTILDGNPDAYWNID